MPRILLGVVLGLMALFCLGKGMGLCRDRSIWCPQMSTHGACGFYNKTRETCPRRCGLCDVQCQNVKLPERRECGHLGITLEHCERRGCCFVAPIYPHNQNKTIPWCFYPKAACDFVEGKNRRNCGFLGVTRNQCLDSGCCWSPLGRNSKHPWCHHPE